ncbi:hypothetical protein FBU59_000212 [Linderina macrospora]|uniref:Uncharacterized protein n=1 Tax=Linderina macrospora TaxID=4868 RepID=A0ACC1JHQ4_9FUNG|nr:hypothetical protein FBU59_000212 [Linderina macrospora]
MVSSIFISRFQLATLSIALYSYLILALVVLLATSLFYNILVAATAVGKLLAISTIGHVCHCTVCLWWCIKEAASMAISILIGAIMLTMEAASQSTRELDVACAAARAADDRAREFARELKEARRERDVATDMAATERDSFMREIEQIRANADSDIAAACKVAAVKITNDRNCFRHETRAELARYKNLAIMNATELAKCRVLIRQRTGERDELQRQVSHAYKTGTELARYKSLAIRNAVELGKCRVRVWNLKDERDESQRQANLASETRAELARYKNLAIKNATELAKSRICLWALRNKHNED